MTEVKELIWDRPNPFILDVCVSGADIDSYQHVNNSVYSRWADDCARAHSAQVGIDAEQAFEFGYGMAVRESNYIFHASAYRDDKVLVAAWITYTDKKLKIRREFQMVRAADNTTLVRAAIDYVCINIHSGRAAKMPPNFRELYTLT